MTAAEFLKDIYNKKPENFFISEINWKYLIRNIYNGSNIIIVGPTGCGKTCAVLNAASIFPERKFFNIPLGASQDPRSTLIGNTHYNSQSGTFFSESEFVKAIQIPYAIILLDELRIVKS